MPDAPENSGNGRKLWPIILSAASVSFVVIGGAVTFIYQIAGLTNDAIQTKAEVKALQVQLEQLTERQNDARSRLVIMETRQTETDTQFCAMDVIRNLMHANELRIESMLWRKVFDQPIPTDNAYYPSLCATVKPEVGQAK